MKKHIMYLSLIGLAITAVVSGCNSGSKNNDSPPAPAEQCGGGSGGTTWDPNPYSCPAVGNYNGTLFNQISQPNIASNGVLANNYPESYLPTYAQGKAVQIAYGRNDESAVAKISAYVTINNNSLCSATPVKYDSDTNTTLLIGAAHCFAENKTDKNTIESSNLAVASTVKVYYGVSSVGRIAYPVTAVYLQQNYCYGATFTGENNDNCPNFTPTDGVQNGQGNDISIIEIQGEFGGAGNHVNYPQVAPAAEYPTTDSMAPVLSIGYGVSTQSPAVDSCNGGRCAIMYYVAGYQYVTAQATGYSYLYNSYYNSSAINAFGKTGYTALICGGDSGGGDLFWTGTKWILLSEHTYGPSGACGTFYNYLPNAATNVSSYYAWIMSIFNSPTRVASCQNGTIANCVTNG